MTNCPVCGKPVDPLRAPAVSVRDGKVVSYCSKDCAALSESGPAKLIPTKVMRMPSEPSGERPAIMRAPTPTSGIVEAGGGLESGPVIEIVREGSKPVGARAKRADSQSVQIADTGHIDDYITPDAPRRKGLVLAVLLLVVAGGAAAAYFLGYLDGLLGRERGATAPLRRDAAVVAPSADAATPAITREQAVAAAQAALRTHLQSPPRVQHLAAAALARTGDKDAIELLATAVREETSDIAKLKLAYALARAGDKRGFDALMAGASPTKREAKHEAGGRLALLGDPRATNVLAPSLPYPQLRLGVAEQLAYIAEPRAVKILDEVRADPKALPEEKARAAIALGWAGRSDIAPALHELLADNRNNSLAARALANLHDEAARPVLVKQLEVPSIRVQAARSLRRLAPDADLTPLLGPLVAQLTTLKDTDQIDVAETLLLLAGPAAWSERE